MKAIPISLSLLIFTIMGAILYKSVVYQAALPKPQIPTSEEVVSTITFSGWIPWWDQNSAITNTIKFGGDFQVIDLTWAYLDGAEVKFKDLNNNKIIANKLKDNGFEPYLTLSNVVGSDVYGDIPNNAEALDKVITDTYALIDKFGLAGLNLDLEYITVEEQKNYEELVKRFSLGAKSRGLGFSIAVPAISDSRHNWQGAEGFDFEFLCKYTDDLIVMVYDLSNPNTGPGAIASFQWSEEAIVYALKRCDVSKIVLGLPLYGYVWDQQGSFVEAISPSDLETKYNNLSKTRDDKSGELVASNNKFTIYFSDQESIEQKIGFAREYGINRFALWHLGNLNFQISF